MNNLVRMKDNYTKALNRLRKTTGLNPEVSAYLGLSKEDLDALREHYGPEQVDQYVMDMEQKRGQHATNG